MCDVRLAADERLDAVNEKITLIQKKDGLTFGTDAFLLAAFIKAQKNSRAAELGTGTGIIALLCAARAKLAHIDAIEIQPDFYELTKRNVSLNGFEDIISVINADVRDVNAAFVGKEVDAVFTNPPYMRTDCGSRNVSDRRYIARHEVCGGIDDFCAAAYRLLKHGGKFYCVWRPDRLTALMAAMKANRLEPKKMVFVHADTDSEPSTVLISACKGGAEGLTVMPPLFLYESTRDGASARVMTDRAKKIYASMEL